MNISLLEFKRVSFTLLDQEIDLSDDTISKLAVFYRSEFPKRNEFEGNYVAQDNKSQKVLMIDDDSIQIRFHKVVDIEENIALINNIVSEFSRISELQDGEYNINLVALYQISDFEDNNNHKLSLENLFPKKVDYSDVPGNVLFAGTRITFEVNEVEYDLMIQPSFEHKDSLLVTFIANTDTKIDILETNFKDLINDTRYLLDGTIKKIVSNW